MLVIIIFSYIPMVGIVIAFQRFIPARGFLGDQQWIGFGNFEYILSLPNATRALKNTVVIAFFKITLGELAPITFAILLNEMSSPRLKKTLQTSLYLPHFLSWIILGGIVIEMLSPSHGVVNTLLTKIGIEPIFFLGDNFWFPITIVVTYVWKVFGFGTIIYLAAISNISPHLYEAARIDGANRVMQVLHITLPGMARIIILIAVLNLGNVLNAGFDQIFNLYSPRVYESGDILDTFIYRIGILEAQFGPSTAVGLFKSAVSLLFISGSYIAAKKFADYQVF